MNGTWMGEKIWAQKGKRESGEDLEEPLVNDGVSCPRIQSRGGGGGGED